MKIETKLKIIRWVKKLLNYDETKMTSPWIESEREYRKVELVRSTIAISEKDLPLSDFDRKICHENLTYKIAKELQKNGFISFPEIEVATAYQRALQIEAQLKVILP